MALIKSLLFVGLAVLAILGHNVASGQTTPKADRDQTVLLGYFTPYDKVLHTERVDVSKSFLAVKTREISYPAHSTSPQGSVITGIKVLDQLRTGKNAYVKVTAGGVGQKFAKILLTSKRGYPIRYVVEFYGR